MVGVLSADPIGGVSSLSKMETAGFPLRGLHGVGKIHAQANADDVVGL